MSIPYQIADLVTFDMLYGRGHDVPFPIFDGNESQENTIDVLIRADPQNAGDAADPSTWWYIGTATKQMFPLRPNEAINVHVTKRNMIYVRGPKHTETAKQILHIVSAMIQPAGR